MCGVVIPETKAIIMSFMVEVNSNNADYAMVSKVVGKTRDSVDQFEL